MCINDKSNLPKTVNGFFTYLRIIKKSSENTIQGYASDITLYFRYMKKTKLELDIEFDDIDISDVDVPFIKSIELTDMYDFMEYLTIDRENGENARSRKISSIKSFYTYLQNKAKLITSNENPTLELEKPKIEKRSPITMTLDQAKSLIDAVEEGWYDSKRDKAIIVLLLNCCLRREEVSKLNIDSLYWMTEELEIIGKGNKQRWLSINNSVNKVLTEWLADRAERKITIGDENALFLSKQGNRISKEAVGEIVKKYVTKAGMDATRFTTHKLRSTGITLMYKNGTTLLALQKIAGHENITTTTIYVEADAKEISNAINSSPLNCLC